MNTKTEAEAAQNINTEHEIDLVLPSQTAPTTKANDAYTHTTTKKPTISRSTYFRAKRNLRNGNTKIVTSGKTIGRPQKLNEDAQKLIQEVLAVDPGTELRQLQQHILDHCDISVSLSSISRRLKVLGCSASQQPHAKRKQNDTPIHDTHETPNDLLHSDQQLQQDLDEIEYHNISNDFSPDLENEIRYDSPGIDLDMLRNMQDLSYPELDTTKIGVDGSSQMYAYNAFQDKHLYQQELDPSIYDSIL